MAEHLRAVRVLVAAQGPALPDELALANGRLIDVDNALAGVHQTDQRLRELLSLHARTKDIGSVVHDPGLLELQAKMRRHNLANTLLRQPADIRFSGVTEHLFGTCHPTKLPHKLEN